MGGGEEEKKEREGREGENQEWRERHREERIAYQSGMRIREGGK